MTRCRLTLLVCLWILWGWSAGETAGKYPASKPIGAVSASQEVPLVAPDDLRRTAVHDAGDMYSPIINGVISNVANQGAGGDPETGDYLWATTYPQGSNDRYVYLASLWVGGIAGTDTLVSLCFDGWYGSRELIPEDVGRGGTRRSGNYADDEFVTVLVDTNPNAFNPFPFIHSPLGLQVTVRSYSWADTAYDDFVILDYTITNLGPHQVAQAWAGLYIDNDIYHETFQNTGWNDDFSGTLDTLLYDGDPSSRVLIPYSIDNDGDPSATWKWDETSIRGTLAFMLLASSFPVETTNFNWWITPLGSYQDFGPQMLGTPEDPVRVFAEDNLGIPVTDEDRYFLLSHAEVDYDQTEIFIHDSADGWLPPPWPSISDVVLDTRFLFSFGAFDLAPGDSVTFAVAMAGAGGVHVDPRNYTDYFDPHAPGAFRDRLDFSRLMQHLRRADAVYRSQYTLPHPGPPTGIRVTDYEDAFVELAWHPSHRPDLARYYLYVKDTLVDDEWRRATPQPIADTTAVAAVFVPTHTYFFAVSLSDTLGRESGLSLPTAIVPGRPHPPESLAVSVIDAIPEITWRPHEDTALQVFMIYRAAWRGPFDVYDSTAALLYRDYAAESGVEYHYMVSAKNGLELESDPAGPVTVLPMAMDRGVLFCNLNRFQASNPGPYPRTYMDRIYESIASIIPASRIDADSGQIGLKGIAEYSPIILDAENAFRSTWISEDSLTYYLNAGGKAIFIRSALAEMGVMPRTYTYTEGDFYHDFLKLDSSVTGGVVTQDGRFLGDLRACYPRDAAYPALDADPVKLDQAVYALSGYIPFSGYLFPTDEAEVIYEYVSSNPDTAAHGRPNAIRYLGTDYQFILLNFPPAAMKEQENFRAMRRALVDLGVDMTCGDITGDGAVNIGDLVFLINHLFRSGPPPQDIWRADVNCGQALSMEDLVVLINYIFRKGWLNCCLQE